MSHPLKDPFLQLLARYSPDGSYHLECWRELYEKYTSGSRHYHNLTHLTHMFLELERVSASIQNRDTLLFSIWYHDVVYNPLKKDNEHQSALLFQKRISKTSFSDIDACMAQIVATQAHELSPDPDTNVLLDLDLSILGSSPERYQTYTKNIRKEYAMYPGFLYRKGRRKVLEHFLSLDKIFKTEFFRNEYETQARENLQQELDLLT